MNRPGVPGRFGAGRLEPKVDAAPAPAGPAVGDTWSNTPGWREFFDLLSDAVVVLTNAAEVRFANTAALRLLPCEPGASVDQLRAVLGAPAVGWIRAALASGPPPALPSTPPAARLADGRSAQIDFRRLDARHSALRLVPTAAPAPSPPAPPPSPPLALGPTLETIAFLWESPFPATLQGADFRLIDVNPAFCALVGRSREALIGRDPREYQPPDDQDRIEATRRRLRADRSIALEPVFDGRLLDASGRERRFRLARRPLVDERGGTYYLALLQETTAEHSARERADRSLRELDDWFELSPVGMVLLDERGVLLRHNAALAALTGEPPATLAEAEPEVAGLLGWDEAVGMPALDPAAPPETRRVTLTGLDGASRSLRASLRCYRTAGGHRRTMAIVEDCTAEEAHELARVQIGALMETAGIGVATFQEASGWLRLSPPAGTAAPEGGAPPSRAAALQSIGRDLVLPGSIAEFERLQAALREGRRAELRYAIRHPELGERWLLTRVEPATLASGKRTTSVVTLDITEQHETQQRTEQLLRELSMILESVTAGIAYLRDDRLVRCNRGFEAMLGLAPGSAEGRAIGELLAGLDTPRDAFATARRELARDGVFETELEAVATARGSAGRTRWYSLSLRGRASEDRVAEAIAVVTDISRLKAQQREFEVLARDRELMFNFTDIGVAMLREGRIQRANEALARLTGVEVDRLSGQPLAILYGGDDEYARFWPRVEAALALHGHWSGERLLGESGGRGRWVQVTKRLLVPGDLSAGMIGSYVDVDARHRAVRAIALQADRTRAILDSALVGIVTVGADGIEWMNRSARRMFAGALADFVGQPIATVATPEPDHPFRRTAALETLVEGRTETFECRLRARDGREFWVVGNVVSTGTEPAGRQLTYALLDIERRREAEARVSEARAQLQRIIEAAPLAITLRDARTLAVLQVNDVAARSIGKPADRIVGLALEQLYPPALAASRRADMEAALRSHHVVRREYRTRSPDDANEIWDVRYMPLSAGPGDAPDQLLMVATDVTEQRAVQEARVEAAIAQRDMLVKEVHHRIKNNLQGVAGLLQQIAQKKPEVAGPIAEVVGQVQAIAQVYGLQVGADGPLGLSGVVRAIAGSVQRTFGRTIEVEVGGDAPEAWRLPEAESIPIALTLNELLTNAIKHSAGAGGSVGCTLACSAAEVEVRIVNRGRLPDGFDLDRVRGGVSGLGLVRALLPRRSAVLTLAARGEFVEAAVRLRPPSVVRGESSTIAA